MAETFEGYNCRVEVQQDALVLKRLGVASKVHGVDMEPQRIALRQVTDVELHDATRLNSGWLRIALNGEPLVPVRRPPPYDPLTLIFLRRSQEDFQRLYEILRGVAEDNRRRGPDDEPQDVAEQIRKLTDLHAACVLTDEELETKTRMLRGR